MGIGALRRYHKPVESTDAPDVQPGPTPTEEEARLAAEANAAKIAEEQQAQADAAEATGTGAAVNPSGETAESVHPVIQEQGAEEAGGETPTVPVAETPSNTPGDVSVVTEADLSVAEPVHLDDSADRKARAEAAELNRGSSKAKWVEFAKADGFDTTDRSRDEIAEHYLGARA